MRILRGLAHGERVATTELTQEQKIPLQFAYKIIKKLENAKLINISRGKTGGCLLLCDLHEVSLYQLMVAMDEGRYLSPCMQEGYVCDWRAGQPSCMVHCQLAALQTEFSARLRDTSLHQLIFGNEDTAPPETGHSLSPPPLL